MNQKNILVNPITDGISVISAIKNRNEHLKESLPTWVNNPDINEIILIQNNIHKYIDYTFGIDSFYFQNKLIELEYDN